MVPAADVAGGEQALSDSFLLPNAAPQNSTMNASAWRRLENRVRKLAQVADSVIVVTGAIFAASPERIGAGGVAVPTELYEVILVLDGGRPWVAAAIVPNTEAGSGSLDSFAVTMAEVERRTGLKLFHELPAGPHMTGGQVCPANEARK